MATAGGNPAKICEKFIRNSCTIPCILSFNYSLYFRITKLAIVPGSFIGFGRGSHSSGHSTNQGAYYTGSRTPWNTFSGSMSERDQMEWAMRDSSSMNRRSSSRPSTNIYDRPPASHRTASTDGIYPHLDDAQTYANHFYHEASAPAEDDSMTFTTQTSRTVHSDPTSSSHNYPDIGFIRQQRVNRYT